MNLIGLPTTARSERAAPPLVSESNLVRITPDIPTFSSNSFAISTALCPVIASATKSVSSGLDAFATLWISSIRAWSRCMRPEVSMMTVSIRSCLALDIAASATFTGSFSPGIVKTGTPAFSPSTWSCVMAAGRTRSAATSITERPSFFRRWASLCAAVVFPEP